MAEFKVGDQVIRQKNLRHGAWGVECALHDHADDDVFTVVRVDGGVLWVNSLPSSWDCDCFRRAYPPSPVPATNLSAEDRLCESDAHIECLRDLLEAEKRQVGNLLALNNVLVDQAAHLQAKIAGLQAEVARCCGTVADKEKMQQLSSEIASAVDYKASHEVLRQQVVELDSKLAEAYDQRDVAVLAAKALGEDLRHARADTRLLRLYRGRVEGLAQGLLDAIGDTTTGLSQLSQQLELIGKMCDEQGNGADAQMLFDAASVCAVVLMAACALEELTGKQLTVYPAMENPLA